MQDLRGIYDPRIKSLALGKFDAMHIAHFELFRHLQAPSAIVMIDQYDKNILCNSQETLIEHDFKDTKIFRLDLQLIKEMNGEEFVEWLKKSFCGLEKIVVGYDFAFGIHRSCNSDDLKRICARFNISAMIVPEVKFYGLSVHSGLIKKALERGYLHVTEKLLGRRYSVRGHKIKGQGIGSREIFATINLDCNPYFLPKNGVYAVLLNGFLGAGFIGVRSTDQHFSFEVHLLDLPDSWKMLDGVMEIEFLAFIRNNRHFPSTDLLKEQISRDIKEIRERFSLWLGCRQ